MIRDRSPLRTSAYGICVSAITIASALETICLPAVEIGNQLHTDQDLLTYLLSLLTAPRPHTTPSLSSYCGSLSGSGVGKRTALDLDIVKLCAEYWVFCPMSMLSCYLS